MHVMLMTLREGTREDHEQLESQPLLSALLTPNLKLRDYGRVLRVLHGFYQQIERELSCVLPTLYSSHPQEAYHYQSRLHLLTQDLVDINQKPPEKSRPLTESRLLAPGPGAALGILYVLEGASQGGRVISRCVAKSLTLGPDYGARYFHQHERIDSWSAYRCWLPHVFDAGEMSLAVSAACAVFRELGNRLETGD